VLNYEIKVEEGGDSRAGAYQVGKHDDLVTGLGLATQKEPPPAAVSAVAYPHAATRTGQLVTGVEQLNRLKARRDAIAAAETTAATQSDDDDGFYLTVASGPQQPRASSVSALRRWLTSGARGGC
jgi:hypothetical protein